MNPYAATTLFLLICLAFVAAVVLLDQHRKRVAEARKMTEARPGVSTIDLNGHTFILVRVDYYGRSGRVDMTWEPKDLYFQRRTICRKHEGFHTVAECPG